MTLASGTRLGAYEILAPVGAGGMGEVYKGRDTRLNRDVAIKILPDPFAADPERLARFDREAQLLASLNHPHIAHVYGLEQFGAQRAIVMEFVDGVTLADRLVAHGAPRALPIDEAVAIAKQIAEGLEAAHEIGVIHRDLKPANIKIRPDGTVKLLDFGLAKALDAAGPLHMSSPTITSPALTAAGVLMGTAAYMSPEQVRGQNVDRRADIWAFGCVLFEMLTGGRLFDGATVSDTFADVLRKEIEWSRLPDATPPALAHLLRRCLTRDPRSRLRDIGDARIALENDLNAPQPVGPVTARWSTRSLLWPPATAVAVIAAAVSLTLWSRARVAPPPVQPSHVSFELGDGVTLATDLGVGPTAVLSPDGSVLAYVGRKGPAGTPLLYVRRLDQLTSKALEGTEGALDPFFSPDGRSLGFFSNGKLNTIPVAGGAVSAVADALSDRGGSWAADGSIFFTPSPVRGGTVMKVASAGGAVQAVTRLDANEVTHRWPQILPGGDLLLYTAHSQTGSYDQANLIVSSVSDMARRKIVYRGGYHARYLPTGHLAFISKGTLFAAPFDLTGLEVTGPAFAVMEQVTSQPTSGGAEYSFSQDGRLVYSRGAGIVTDATIAWIDKTITSPLRKTPADYFNPRFSPDGQRMALDIGANWGDSSIWTYDLRRESLTRLTFNGQDSNPIWSPDGKRIVFSSLRDGDVTDDLYWQRSDGTGKPERLTTTATGHYGSSWHPNGKILAYTVEKTFGALDLDVGILTIEGSEQAGWKVGSSSSILNTSQTEAEPAFSPDGRWVAYTSVESGRPEVYVVSFPGLQRKSQISTDGGITPVWSRTRPEIFYGTMEGGIMVTPYKIAGDSLVAGKPQAWAPKDSWSFRSFTRPFDLHPDDRRFAVLKGVAPPARPHVVLMSNFFEEVRKAAAR